MEDQNSRVGNVQRVDAWRNCKTSESRGLHERIETELSGTVMRTKERSDGAVEGRTERTKSHPEDGDHEQAATMEWTSENTQNSTSRSSSSNDSAEAGAQKRMTQTPTGRNSLSL